jgi:4-amino-4-deoxy-L-arabinose transferase-like glycosyltransferase
MKIGKYALFHSRIQWQNSFVHYAILLVLIYFVIFAKLGDFPFRFWDESMFAVNAYEMEKNGNYMVPFFDNEIDWRNSKPLLLTWLQVGFIKLFGFNELTIRLPSAIAVAASVLMLFHYLRKRVNVIFAWTASLILLTSVGYIGFHTGRTGDADALLSFFLLGFTLFFLDWIVLNNPRNLVIAALFFALAIVTKSFAAFLFLPGALIFSIYNRKGDLIQIFKQVNFYLALFLIMLSLFMAFVMREIYQPGYLHYTLYNDAYRLSTVIETHQHGWDFYLESMFYYRYAFWSVPFIIGVFLTYKLGVVAYKNRILAVLLIVFFYFFIISCSVTKLVWYDMPLFPLLAVVTAIPIYSLLMEIGEGKSKWFLVTMIAIVFAIPYRKMFFAAQSNSMEYGDRMAEMTSLYLHDKTKQNLEENLTVFHYGYAGSLLCYRYMYADQGKELKVTYDPLFVDGEKVFVSNENLKHELNLMYKTDTLEIFETGVLFVVLSRK